MAVIEVALFTVNDAFALLNLTAVAPVKFVPIIATEVPPDAYHWWEKSRSQSGPMRHVRRDPNPSRFLPGWSRRHPRLPRGARA